MRFWIASLILLGALSTSCLPDIAPEPSLATPTATQPAALFSTPQPTSGAPARRLTLWLAPEFAASPDMPAGLLLAERLAAFERANPGVTITTRLKSRAGPAGLLETLTAAFAAAPDSLPDMITLDREALQAAAVKSMIVPLEALRPPLESPAWSEHAVLASQVDGTPFGVPLGSDADLLAYRADIYGSPPETWSELLNG
ncbi:MAG: extracellular solute-binding protein, partial [Anaerolineales bacterium]|nr:extracellular solute-binding protein [Anaerolineales bacterium]